MKTFYSLLILFIVNYFIDYSTLVSAQTCNAGTCWDGSACSTTPPGKYSVTGTRAACQNCAAGRYGTGGSTTSSCTGAVLAGYYSLAGEGTTSYGSGPCAAGRYGTGGSINNQCT